MTTCEGREMEALSVSNIKEGVTKTDGGLQQHGSKKIQKTWLRHRRGEKKKTKWEYVLLVILEWKSSQKNKSNKQESKHPGAVSVLKTWDIRI